jgi:hypothetical protein
MEANETTESKKNMMEFRVMAKEKKNKRRKNYYSYTLDVAILCTINLEGPEKSCFFKLYTQIFTRCEWGFLKPVYESAYLVCWKPSHNNYKNVRTALVQHL